MAMNANQMAQLVAQATNDLGISEPSDQQIEILEAMCEGIIEHIQNQAQVTTVIPSGSSSGTYTGSIQ